MMILSLVALLASAHGATNAPDGSKLRPGQTCYQTVVDGKVSGSILRTVTRTDEGWLITINSNSGGQRMDTQLTVSFADMRPIRLRNDGETFRYRPGGVSITGSGGKVSDRALPDPIWEGSGLEFLVTTLPLAEGASFDIPTWGGGDPQTIHFEVPDSAMIETPDGKVPAWRVLKRWADGTPVYYLVAKSDRRLLGMDVVDVHSRIGGDCSPFRT